MSNYCTIDGFENMTAQEVFDMSAKHLLKQNAKSIVDSVCRYRLGALQCAAGPFLKQERVQECDDGTGDGSSWFCLHKTGMVPEAHLDLVIALQNIHDDSNVSVEEWPEKLAQLAAGYSLNFTHEPEAKSP